MIQFILLCRFVTYQTCVMSLHVSHNFNPGMTFAFPVTVQDDWKQANINDRLSVIGYLFAHRSLGHGANIATCMAKGCSDVQRTILGRGYRLFAALLSEMDLGNADTRVA